MIWHAALLAVFIFFMFAQSGGNVDGPHVARPRTVLQSRAATPDIKLYLLGG